MITDTKGSIFTRAGDFIPAPDYFVERLPGAPLDGVLRYADCALNKINFGFRAENGDRDTVASIVFGSHSSKNKEAWRKLKLYVYLFSHVVSYTLTLLDMM